MNTLVSQTENTNGNALTLPDLATQINQHHAECEKAVTTALGHAMEAGRLLTEAKSKCGHGEWMPWLESNFNGSGRTARAYMRVSDNREAIEANWQTSANMSIDGALKLIAGPRIAADIDRSSPQAFLTSAFRLAIDTDDLLMESEAFKGCWEEVKQASHDCAKDIYERLEEGGDDLKTCLRLHDEATAVLLPISEYRVRCHKRGSDLYAELVAEKEQETKVVETLLSVIDKFVGGDSGKDYDLFCDSLNETDDLAIAGPGLKTATCRMILINAVDNLIHTSEYVKWLMSEKKETFPF